MNLCNLTEVRALLDRYGLAPKKGFGQNFLIRSAVPMEISASARRLAPSDKPAGVLEIGPGVGALTQYLCADFDRVVCVEIDHGLIPLLGEVFGETDNVTVVEADFMQLDLPAFLAEHFGDLLSDGGTVSICANLPYYITTPVLAALLESRAFEAVTVMVQKEVAQRICSPAGKGDYGAFSVFCQYYAEPELLFDVPASCFIPQPKVTSAVLKLTMRKESVCEIKSEAMFFKVVRAAFVQRRKTLLNALSSGLSQFDKPALAAVIEDCGFAPTVRGETLDIPGFAAIANALTEL